MNYVLKLLFLFLAVTTMAPAAQAQTLKIATLAPAGTTWMNEMSAGAKAIEEKTTGRVVLKFYPGGVMGNDQSVHRKIRIGQLHGGAFTPGGMAAVNSSIQSLGLPMMFSSLHEVDYVRPRLDPVIKAEMENNGFVVLGISEGGFLRILSKNPMRDLESIRASKVWVPEGDALGQITFKALGISPVALPISDVFTGLQTGLIETVVVNPTAAIAFQWHTSTGFMTDAPIGYIIGVLAVQKKAFDKLSLDDQRIVREEMQDVFQRMDKLNRNDNEAASAALQQQGIQFVTPNPGEVERWQSLSAEAIENMVKDGNISAAIVDQVKGYLQQFRKAGN